LAGRAPAHREAWRRWEAQTRARLDRADVDVRLHTAGRAEDAEGHDLVVLATGARPYMPGDVAPAAASGDAERGRAGSGAAPATGLAIVDAWAAIAAPERLAGPVLVADWGGWDGLDAAEVLAEAGLEVTPACAAPSPGDVLHQYQRNLYLARLDLAGIALLHHMELATADEALTLRHVFSGRRAPLPAVATLVVAHGRVPEDGLWAALEGRPGCVRAGDALGSRSMEEAVLEGVTAYRAARAEVLAG
jgi:hypothetical protein